MLGMKKLLQYITIGVLFVLRLEGAEPRGLTNSIGMKLVSIEPGTFSMGQDTPRADYSTMRHAENVMTRIGMSGQCIA